MKDLINRFRNMFKYFKSEYLIGFGIVNKGITIKDVFYDKYANSPEKSSYQPRQITASLDEINIK